MVSNARLDLPGPGQPGDHDERVAGQLEVHVPKVVLPRSRDDYPILPGDHDSRV